MVRIILGITTKDDADILTQRLSDLRSLIDGLVVCDCSTNTSTRDVAQSFLDETKLPGHIVTTTFQGRFDTLNNLLFNSVKTLIHEQGFPPELTYGLFLDDINSSVYPSYNYTTIKENLDQLAYSINCESHYKSGGGISCAHYIQRILLRMDYNWQSMGWHSCQYWDCSIPITNVTTNLLQISDIPKVSKG